ncbi:hypothetical protein KO489_04010 [Reinekea forsetii]|nr:hypothetical protein [Reinekea forsetii]
MCGIFGVLSSGKVSISDIKQLASHARQRGRDSSGLILLNEDKVNLFKADFDIAKLLSRSNLSNATAVLGHSRLVTNGLQDNQPVVRGDICVIHNGIVVNSEKVWEDFDGTRRLEIDTEIIAAIAEHHVNQTGSLAGVSTSILDQCKGVIATAIYAPKLGQIALFSNNGSLYTGEKNNNTYFSSEEYPLNQIGCHSIVQIREVEKLISVRSEPLMEVKNYPSKNRDLVPKFMSIESERKLLITPEVNVNRCSKCILPETMPYITFNENGVCNYCESYEIRNKPKPVEEIFELVKPYRRKSGHDCIVPFSGGRDSCYGLHLIVNELKMKPVTYTYDWGMVTDLGRRNISRMCAELGVENIIVADNISKKRNNIAKNLKAWLKNPNLGMISILTAGDKHFFRHVESVKKQTGIDLNLWGVNPLEVTHFKSGFLGVPPDFEEKRVYSHGWQKQLEYQKLRFKAMLKSPGYFNSSLWDTLSGEYYRSFTEKRDYFHIFDYWHWDEKIIDNTLINDYGWETAVDTNTTWRIGDGTAALYNYIYYLVAGFTEHDTFRSNQIREGEITREEALVLVKDENQPRYENIRWYLDALGMDFTSVINIVNKIPRLY